MAGGSQIIISDKGIKITTNGKVIFQAGEHVFEGGREVKAEFPILPIARESLKYTNRWDFYDLFYEYDFSDVKYKLINNQKKSYVSATLDEHGRTQRIGTSDNEEYDLLIGSSDDWTVSIDDGSEDDDFSYQCSCSSHEHEDPNEGI